MLQKQNIKPVRFRQTALAVLINFFSSFPIVVRKFIKDQCLIRAAGLAFTFLLVFIPLLTLMLSLFSGFGAFDSVIKDVQAFFLETLLPAKQDELAGFLNQFTTNTKALGIFGLIIFLFTAIFFLINVENNFNAIWGTTSNKKFISRFTSNTSVLVFGTMLLGASFSFSGAMQDLLTLLNPESTPDLNNFFLWLFPFLFMILFLLLLIILIPALRVQFSSALIGALCGSILWEIAKQLFRFWTNSSIQFSVIYGSFALVPIFLIWVYIGWLIVLMALEITYVHQYREDPWYGDGWSHKFPAAKLLVGFHIFLHIARGFHQGLLPRNCHNIARDFSMKFNDIMIICEALEKGGLVLPFDKDNGQLIPARDLSTITLSDVAACLFGQVPEKVKNRDWEPALKIVQDFKVKAFSGLEEKTVLDFLDNSY